MIGDFNLTMPPINYKRIFIGVLCLFLAAIFYLFKSQDRIIYFIKFFDLPMLETNCITIKILSNHIPDMIHPFVFILLTSALIPFESKKMFLLIASFWCIVNLFFEIGQLFKTTFISRIPNIFNSIPFLENTESFFVNGTFDVFDICATVLGSVMGYIFLLIHKNKKNSR